LPLCGLLLLLLSASKPVSVQENLPSAGNSKADELLQKQDTTQRAQFPGGRKALNNYREDNITIPAIAFEWRGKKEVIMGAEMVVQIAADGAVKFVKYQSLHVQPNEPAVVQAVKEELNQFILKLPKWAPALQNGRPISSRDTITFITSYAPWVTFEEYQKSKRVARAEREKATSSSTDLRTKDGKKVYTFVQKQASYPGGDKALKEFLIQNLKYLQSGQNTGQLVVLNIIVNEKGTAEDLKVVKPEGVTLNPQEVEAALKQMPTWNPGKQSGKPLPVSYIFPVRF
jgi:hypothetical protein